MLEVLRRDQVLETILLVRGKGKKKNVRSDLRVVVIITRDFAVRPSVGVEVDQDIAVRRFCAAFGIGSGARDGTENQDSCGQTKSRERCQQNGKFYPILTESATWLGTVPVAEVISL